MDYVKVQGARYNNPDAEFTLLLGFFTRRLSVICQVAATGKICTFIWTCTRPKIANYQV